MSNQYLAIYEKAVFIRAFEQEIAKQFDAGHVPGLVHLCCGAEVAEAALLSTLDTAIDQVTGSHRSHGLALAAGVSPYDIACEILGRADGLSAGLAGTQHLIAPGSGFLTSNGIVGAQVPLAAGAALSAKARQTGGIGVAVFGDGAANQGAVFETMNLSVSFGLPLLFVLENNGFGQSTTSQYASGAANYAKRAQAFGLDILSIDGFKVEDCCSVFQDAVSLCRGGTPVFVEVTVPRLAGHYHGENTDYINEAATDDPLDVLALSLTHAGVDASVLAHIGETQKLNAVQVIADAVAAPTANAELVHAWSRNMEAVRGG